MGVEIMWSHMRADDSIEIEINLLVDSICSETNSEDCMNGFKDWWPKIAANIYSSTTVDRVCNGLSNGECDAPSFFGKYEF